MRLLDRLRTSDSAESERSTALTFEDVLTMFAFNGNIYQGMSSPLRSPGTPIAANFPGFVQGVYNSSGIVAAAITARALLMSQIRFQWRSLLQGETGRLFGTTELAVLERPGDLSRAELLYAAEQHNSLAGNAFFYRNNNQLRLLRPDWVTIVFGSYESDVDPTTQLDAELVGYTYQPGGMTSKNDPIFLALLRWRIGSRNQIRCFGGVDSHGSVQFSLKSKLTIKPPSSNPSSSPTPPHHS